MQLFEDVLEKKITHRRILELEYVNGNVMKLNNHNMLDQYFTKQEVAL